MVEFRKRLGFIFNMSLRNGL